MKETIEQIVNECTLFAVEAAKKPTKAGYRRMRACTLRLTRLGQQFRRLSIEEEKK